MRDVITTLAAGLALGAVLVFLGLAWFDPTTITR